MDEQPSKSSDKTFNAFVKLRFCIVLNLDIITSMKSQVKERKFLIRTSINENREESAHFSHSKRFLLVQEKIWWCESSHH